MWISSSTFLLNNINQWIRLAWVNQVILCVRLWALRRTCWYLLAYLKYLMLNRYNALQSISTNTRKCYWFYHQRSTCLLIRGYYIILLYRCTTYNQIARTKFNKYFTNIGNTVWTILSTPENKRITSASLFLPFISTFSIGKDRTMPIFVSILCLYCTGL